MADIHKNALWQLMAQKIMQTSHNPFLREKIFRELLDMLVIHGFIRQRKIYSRCSPEETLIGIRNLSGIDELYGRPNCFYAGATVPDFLEPDGNSYYISSENKENPVFIEGVIKSEKFIDKIMKEVGEEANNFYNNCKNLNKIPFAFIHEKFVSMKHKLDTDLMEIPGGVLLNLKVPFPNDLTFEDVIDLIIYIHPSITGEINAWLKTALCKHCGDLFFYERRSAKFCSETCRMAAAYQTRRSK